MTLAPRTGFATSESGQQRDSGLGKEGKAAQRARNKGNADTKLTKGAGSSGNSYKVAQFPKIDFDELLPDLEHVCDIAAKFAHLQVGKGWQSVNMGIPLAYAHDVLEAHLASEQGMVFVRVYYVPIERFTDLLAEEDENGEQQPA